MSELFGADAGGVFARLRNHGDGELAYRVLVRTLVELCIQKGLFTQAEWRVALNTNAAETLATSKGGT